MMRNVYLEGEMGQRFGTGFQVNAPKVSDVIKCVECNHPSFKKYLIDCHDNDIGFEVDVANSKLDYAEEMLMNLQDGDVTITPIPAGSKSGGAKILAAMAMIALVVAMPTIIGASASLSAAVPVALGGTGMATVTAATGLGGSFMGLSAGTLQLGLGMLAVNIGMMGLAQVMAPDPATDADQEQNYLFNGNQQNIVEGDPVPVLYGQLRVPGQPINFEVGGASSSIYNATAMSSLGASWGVS
jgi:predicted phage tail protein